MGELTEIWNDLFDHANIPHRGKFDVKWHFNANGQLLFESASTRKDTINKQLNIKLLELKKTNKHQTSKEELV